MAPQYGIEIIKVLEENRTDFNEAVRGVSEAQAGASPDPSRWSVLQCVEHVVMVEERFLGWLEAAERLETSRIDREREASLAARLSNRETRSEAPPVVRPSGRFETLARALAEFNQVRARTMQVAEARMSDLYSVSIEHARLGVMNGVELLHAIAGHARRHAEQIREVRANLA
jgi:hypothetical protein